MKDPTIKNIYKDPERNITFEVMNYFEMDQKQIHQVLDEYYRRYAVPAPENGTTVLVVCDSCGPRPPDPQTP